MRIYTNYKAIDGPHGGANSFLRSICGALTERGHTIVTDPDAPADLAFLNALTEQLQLEDVIRLSERGIPIVHRKVGYVVSGGPDMRRRVDGVVWGDRLQIDFSPFIDHTIFQSAYSRDVFLDSGFEGDYTVIHNGVNEAVFNRKASGWERLVRDQKPFWKDGRPLKVIASSWSKDANKGFEEYAKIDRLLGDLSDVEVSFVGRTPDDLRFDNIRTYRARGHRRLARLLRRHHVLLQLARKETCSNALLEGINCGLPVIYLDSGSNKEIAEPYGVEYQGDFRTSVDSIKEAYSSCTDAIQENPFRIQQVADRYVGVFEAVAGLELSPRAGRTAVPDTVSLPEYGG